MQSPSKLPAIIGILLVVIAVGYYFYSTSNAPVSSDSSLTLTTTSSGGGTVGSDVLSLLSEIKGLNIDTSFFQTPVYESLTDFSVTIPSEPVGKSNPFQPLPGSALPVPSPAATPSSAPGR